LSAIVLDGSAGLGMLLLDEQSPYTVRAYDAMACASAVYVPSHWWLETANALLMAERRKRIIEADVHDMLQYLQRMNVITDEQTGLQCAGKTTVLARMYGLTVYDAAYLELAMRRQATLATVDKALAKAAATAGVELLA
jgi:predicted nucleic acid-binding protein